MRHIPVHLSDARRFDAGARPPLEDLDRHHPKIAAAIRKRDTIGKQRSLAETERNRLLDPQRDAEAKEADQNAETTAALAGKPLPKPKAVPALQESREAAQRAFEAQQRAHIECARLCDDAVDEVSPTLTDPRVEARERISKLASELASAVEEEVAASALYTWLTCGKYYPRAETWASEVVPELASTQGIGREQWPTVFPIRKFIETAALTTLED